MLLVLFSSPKDARALLRLEEEHGADLDLMWLLSELQTDLKKLLLLPEENENDEDEDEDDEIEKIEEKMNRLEHALEVLTSSEEENDDDEQEPENSETFIPKTLFFAQCYSTLSSLHFLMVSSSSNSNQHHNENCFHYLLNSLNEIRKILLFREQQQQKRRKKMEKSREDLSQLENITASIVARLSSLFLSKTNNSSLLHQQSSSPIKKPLQLLSTIEIEEHESKTIKKLQTLILLVEMISTLCKTLEHKDHPSSPQTDSLLKELYENWMSLAKTIEYFVETEFVNTKRGQSKIRGQEFRSWLEKYRMKIKLITMMVFDDYGDGESENEEEKSRSVVVVEDEDWFDLMRERIHSLKVARGEE